MYIGRDADWRVSRSRCRRGGGGGVRKKTERAWPGLVDPRGGLAGNVNVDWISQLTRKLYSRLGR